MTPANLMTSSAFARHPCACCRQHFLYFLPLPQGQTSLRPIFETRIGSVV